MERLIEECRTIKKQASTGKSSVAGNIASDFCSRPGHSADKWWINLGNPHNLLKALKKGGKGLSEKSDFDERHSPKPRSKKSTEVWYVFIAAAAITENKSKKKMFKVRLPA